MSHPDRPHCVTTRSPDGSRRPEKVDFPPVQKPETWHPFIAKQRLQFGVVGGELLQDGLVEVVEGVRADCEYHEEGDAEDYAQEAAVDDAHRVRPPSLLGLLHHPPLRHQPLHVVQLLAELVHGLLVGRTCDVYFIHRKWTDNCVSFQVTSFQMVDTKRCLKQTLWTHTLVNIETTKQKKRNKFLPRFFLVFNLSLLLTFYISFMFILINPTCFLISKFSLFNLALYFSVGFVTRIHFLFFSGRNQSCIFNKLYSLLFSNGLFNDILLKSIKNQMKPTSSSRRNLSDWSIKIYLGHCQKYH